MSVSDATFFTKLQLTSLVLFWLALMSEIHWIGILWLTHQFFVFPDRFDRAFHSCYVLFVSLDRGAIRFFSMMSARRFKERMS